MKPVKLGLRSKLIICGVTLLAGYCYWYIGSPILKLVAILVFVVSAEVMVWQWVSLVRRNIVNTLKMTFAGRKAVSWVEISEFRELAKQMGVRLHRKRPFGVKKGLNSAYANHLTKQIVFGEDLLQRLGMKECLALVAHELTHLKQNHWATTFRWLVVAGLIVSSSLSLAAGPAIVSSLICVAAMMIAFVFVNWGNEFAADRGAGIQIGKVATISLLQSVVPASQWQHESETHPSIRSRISKLQKVTTVQGFNQISNPLSSRMLSSRVPAKPSQQLL